MRGPGQPNITWPNLTSSPGFFHIQICPGGSREDYHLRVSGFWAENGVHDAGDALSGFDGARFSTRDHSHVPDYCFYGGKSPGWWESIVL